MIKYGTKFRAFLKKVFSIFNIQEVFCFGRLALIGVELWYYDFRTSLVVVGAVLMIMGRRQAERCVLGCKTLVSPQ